jgi:hypothetical protein
LSPSSAACPAAARRFDAEPVELVGDPLESLATTVLAYTDRSRDRIRHELRIGDGRQSDEVQRLAEWIQGKEEVRIQAEGTDITLVSHSFATVRALHEHLDPAARLIVEPGRSVVGRSMATLYEVVTVKRGAHTHVAVDASSGETLHSPLSLADRRHRQLGRRTGT